MGSSPVPLSQVVLKVHSRCDLACDHCYVYEAADQSWRGRPMVISGEVAAQAGYRIAEHARAHSLKAVQVVLHGGEPLLAGRARLGQVITGLQAALDGVCSLDIRIHTNGVLLSEPLCELFARHGVRVGISLDGDQAANDRHRRYADGRSSYDKVIAAVGLLRTSRFRHLYAGLLCTIDTANDPLVVYESLLELDPPRIDFLLPHATWDHPPIRHQPGGSEYAGWLTAIYDRWTAQGRPVQIRTFDSVLSTLAGGPSFTEALGLEPPGLVVIETDGSYEQVDSLKAAYDGAPATGTTIFTDSLDTVAVHPGITARQQGAAGLSPTCQQCPVVTTCGGGLYTHRYKTGTGFTNPSVYCKDLLTLITHIHTHPPCPPAPPPVPAHQLSHTTLQALAQGLGGAPAVTELTSGQNSLLRALLEAVHRTGASTAGIAPAVVADLGEAWSLLTMLDRDQSQAVAVVLRHPFTRAWAGRCLEQFRMPRRDQDKAVDARLASDLRHLGAIAAAAMIRARAEGAATVPVIDAAVHLPTLGRLALAAPRVTGPTGSGPDTAVIALAGAAVTVQVGQARWTLSLTGLLSGEPCTLTAQPDGEPGEWQPVRTLHAPGIQVALDDTDPYRDCGQWQAAPRLTDAEAARWQTLFGEAWQEIERSHGVYAAELAAGLTTLVPLAAGHDDHEISVAARPAPGAVAIALPADPVTMALLLICGYQRVKIGAVLDFYDLCDPADQRLQRRLQDAYAQLAATSFWRERRSLQAGSMAGTVERRFAQRQADTADAIDALMESGSLTSRGTWFVEDMLHSVRA